MRFELTYMALAPDLKIIAPWKDPAFELRDRESAIDYAKKMGVPVEQKKKIYRQDRNLWHISHEGAEIESPTNEPNGRPVGDLRPGFQSAQRAGVCFTIDF